MSKARAILQCKTVRDTFPVGPSIKPGENQCKQMKINTGKDTYYLLFVNNIVYAQQDKMSVLKYYFKYI